MSFSNIFQFSLYSLTCFVTFILKYLSFDIIKFQFMIIINTYAVNFYILTLNPETFLYLLNTSSRFCFGLVLFQIPQDPLQITMWSINKRVLRLPFQSLGLFFFFFALLHGLVPLVQCCTRSDERQPCLVTSFSRKAFSLLPLSRRLAFCRFYQVEEVSFQSWFAKNIIHEWLLQLSNIFSAFTKVIL